MITNRPGLEDLSDYWKLSSTLEISSGGEGNEAEVSRSKAQKEQKVSTAVASFHTKSARRLLCQHLLISDISPAAAPIRQAAANLLPGEGLAAILVGALGTPRVLLNRTQEITLAKIHAVCPQQRVGHRYVKIEIG